MPGAVWTRDVRVLTGQARLLPDSGPSTKWTNFTSGNNEEVFFWYVRRVSCKRQSNRGNMVMVALPEKQAFKPYKLL